MSESKKKIGIKEIAHRAGVSIGTVDRVLHNRGEVKKETHQKVMAIVNELGYTPNLMAQALSSKKKMTFAVIIPNSSDNNPYWQKHVDGIDIAQNEFNIYNASFVKYFFNATNEQSFCTALDSVLASPPDGVLLCPVFKQSSIRFIDNLNHLQIPYIFVDINIKNTNSIGYFGQDAYQSGIIAAQLIRQNLKSNSIIIVKQSANKIFSDHIEMRINGFKQSFNNNRSIKITTVEIDLTDINEPQKTLHPIITCENCNIFVPNSRAFVLANYIESLGLKNTNIVGYDLLNENVEHLKKGNIKYLLNQRPDEQSYKAITRLVNYCMGRKEITQTNNYSPIDIIIKENVDYYQKSWINNF